MSPFLAGARLRPRGGERMVLAMKLSSIVGRRLAMPGQGRRRARVVLGRLALGVGILAATARADEVEMVGGDKYVGEVVSLGADTLVVRSEVLGTVRLPRGKVAVIALGNRSSTNAAKLTPTPGRPPATNAPAPASTALPTDLASAVKLLGADPAVGAQIQSQLLGAEGAEANAKFREMVTGYLTGRLTVNDIRAQAQSAADQLREIKRELGSDADATLDTYLAVLDRFLGQTAQPTTTSNLPAARPVGKGPTEPGSGSR